LDHIDHHQNCHHYLNRWNVVDYIVVESCIVVVVGQQRVVVVLEQLVNDHRLLGIC